MGRKATNAMRKTIMNFICCFEVFAEKAGVINSQINELLDEIKDFKDAHDNIGDIEYLLQLESYLTDIEAMWLDIYDLQEEYRNV